MTRPALALLHKKFPAAEMDLLVSDDLAPLFDGAPGIHRTIGLSDHWFAGHPSAWRQLWSAFKILGVLKKNRYNLAIDFRGDFRHILLMFFAGIPKRLGYGITGGGFLLTDTQLYPWDAHQVYVNIKILESLGISSPAEPENSPLAIAASQRLKFQNAAGKFLTNRHAPRILLHAGAGYPSKRWPGERFQELIQRMLQKLSGQIILIGTEAEKKFLGDVPPAGERIMDLRGKTVLEDLPVLFEASQIFIGNDSGPAHLAAAQGLETIVLFSGTNDAKTWHPWTKRLHLLTHPVPCSPCEARECPLGHHDCMKKITIDRVFEEIQATLGRIHA